MRVQPGASNPNAEQCQRVLGEIFREFFDDDGLILRPEMTARDIDGWDSLAHIRLLLSIERKFHIKFSAGEIGGLQTVGDLVLLITRKTLVESD
jgi:acyl carrier protein